MTSVIAWTVKVNEREKANLEQLEAENQGWFLNQYQSLINQSGYVLSSVFVQWHWVVDFVKMSACSALDFKGVGNRMVMQDDFFWEKYWIK